MVTPLQTEVEQTEDSVKLSPDRDRAAPQSSQFEDRTQRDEEREEPARSVSSKTNTVTEEESLTATTPIPEQARPDSLYEVKISPIFHDHDLIN